MAAFLLCCRNLSSNNSQALKTVVITGTTRTEGPPPVLGPRVTQFISHALDRRGEKFNVTAVLNPIDLNLPLLEKPHFAYTQTSKVPRELQTLANIMKEAEAYITITPEYNHAPSPGLLNTLNHFGASLFSFKPSAIVSYSAGQWGGARAAHALRPILSELGCLPVSAMIHIPKAQQVLDQDGNVIGTDDEQQRWDSYVDRSFSQLHWWGTAARNHKELVDPTKISPAFIRDPSQRNAP